MEGSLMLSTAKVLPSGENKGASQSLRINISSPEGKEFKETFFPEKEIFSNPKKSLTHCSHEFCFGVNESVRAQAKVCPSGARAAPEPVYAGGKLCFWPDIKSKIITSI